MMIRIIDRGLGPLFFCCLASAVKFQVSQKTPPHQDRRLQLRMLMFVGLIGLGMFAVQLWRIGGGRGGSSHPHYATPESDRTFSNAEPRRPRLADDEVRILPEGDRDAFPEDEELESPERRINDATVAAELLEAVQDNTPGIRKNEADAFYSILEKANSIPLKTLRQEAVKDVLHVNLMSSPETFRGFPITILGEVINLYEYQAGDNRYGVTRLYDAWILTADSGNQPYRVVCQSIPPELKPGEKLHQSVSVTGYFFKKEAYEAKNGHVQVAPTLLAGPLSLYRSPHAPPFVDEMAPWLVGVITVIGLGLLATVIGLALSDSRSRRWQIAPELSAVDAAAFPKVDHRLSIAESLRRLENDEPLRETMLTHEAVHGEAANGHVHSVSLQDELIDLPTPFPPTRTIKRWSDSQ